MITLKSIVEFFRDVGQEAENRGANHPVFLSQASTAVPDSQASIGGELSPVKSEAEELSQEEFEHNDDDGEDDGDYYHHRGELSPVKSEAEELSQEEFEHNEDDGQDDGDDDLHGEFPPFHEFHRFRNLRQMARRLMKHSGLDMEGFVLGTPLLQTFFLRYHCLERIDDGAAYWKFSFERENQNATLPRRHCSNRTRATLTAHSLKRQFRGQWCISKRLAEQSAVNAFREDPKILEIAKALPPTLKRIRANLRLTKLEKSSLQSTGIEPRDVVKELIHAVYPYFRDMGCRTATWDGNA